MAAHIYAGLELSLERAKRLVPEYSSAYEWFISHEDTYGPLPYGDNTPPGIGFPLAAQRGIHKPADRNYAISIKSSGVAAYADDKLYEFEDGTWMLRYCAHHRNAGEKEASPEYNRSLMRCLTKGLPVGVFVKTSNGYHCRGLAFVERYDDLTDTFMLHGPIRADNSYDTLSPIDHETMNHIYRELNDQQPVQHDFEFEELQSIAQGLTANSNDERERVLAEIVRRKGQERFRSKLLEAYDRQCAVTRYHAIPTLQAAHIMSYLGKHSQIVTNGLLLRADIHILYDKYLIAVDPETMKVQAAPSLSNTEYRELGGTRIHLPADPRLHPAKERLAAHFSEFLARAARRL